MTGQKRPTFDFPAHLRARGQGRASNSSPLTWGGKELIVAVARRARKVDEMRKRIEMIIRRMCQGERFFSKNSPRMTKKEDLELDCWGFRVQSESVHGADPSAGRIYYPLCPSEFKERAIEHEIIKP